ncbi:MAG: hypothetical protein A2785_01080 [Candidatus Chisholmbacteria bacterium RIFCSPHIGHO2_01_FULL_49_18]|uniref:Uncharacterized protein n=1 Tax=Candidatus Chisholmbacteria bacterium RIFCSPHIGHO2_01_FULL_49_18 TaxID=1797590 RepID=A0A1G1VLC6_9BACT|nr:MAG: hypothetical protein A2785_01080 [Candidatus Chisholmbacteria bacterium RIFCSPHIGHO2_01_FULL_49_18]
MGRWETVIPGAELEEPVFPFPLAANEKKLPPLTNIFHNSVNCIFVYLFIQNRNDQILKGTNAIIY